MNHIERFSKLRDFEQKTREVQEYQAKQELAERLRINKTFSPRIKKVCRDFSKAVGWKYIFHKDDSQKYGNFFTLNRTLGHGVSRRTRSIHINIKLAKDPKCISVDALLFYSDQSYHSVLRRGYGITCDAFSEEWLFGVLEACYKAFLT